LDAGADIDADFRDRTPLMLAAEKNYKGMVVLLLNRNADPNIQIKGKTAYNLAKDPEVQELLKPKEEKVWKGYSKSDIELFEQFFEDPENWCFCPVCLDFTHREKDPKEKKLGCMYLAHRCKPEFRNEKLHKLYIDEIGNTGFCTICGRICNVYYRHSHHIYAPPEATLRPPFAVLPTGPDVVINYYGGDADCRMQGGGGIEEKVRRIQTLVDTACELQSEVGKADGKETRDKLIEAVWKGSQDTTIDAKKILEAKKFIPTKCTNQFPLKETATSEFYPSVRRPKDERKLTPIKFEASGPVGAGGGGVECFVHLGTDRPVYRFRHKQPDGSIYEHVGEEICAPDLLEAIKADVVTGKCPINPEKCKGYLYPEELVGILEPKDLESYTKLFNRAMFQKKKEEEAAAAAPGANAAAQAPGANAAQQGGARDEDSIMHPMEDAECVVPPNAKRGGNRKTYRAVKKSRRRTYKS
jgi:hypothetical protein